MDREKEAQPQPVWAGDARDAQCSPGPPGTLGVGALVSPQGPHKRTGVEMEAERSHSHKWLPVALHSKQ